MSDQLSSNGQFIFGRQDGRAYLTDLATGTRLEPPAGPNWLSGTQITSMSADGTLVLVAGTFDDGAGGTRTVDFLWDRDANAFEFLGRSDSWSNIGGSIMSDDGRTFVVCDSAANGWGHADEIYIYDRFEGRSTHPVTAPVFGDVSATLTLVGLSGDAGKLLYITAFGDLPGAPAPTLTWLDVATGTATALAATPVQAAGAALSHNGLYVFLPGVDGADGAIYAAATGALVGTVQGVTHADFVSDDGLFVHAQTPADWTADGSDAGADNDVYKVPVWDGTGEPPVATLLTRHMEEGSARQLVLNGVSADGSVLHVSSGRDIYKGETAASGTNDYTIDVSRAADAIDTASERGEAIEGGGEGDTIAGLGGDDRLYGRAGDDTLDGGEGDDRLDGGEGQDTLHGGTGDDILHGGAGDDIAYGEAGSDLFVDGAGSDHYHGGGDADGGDRDIVVFEGSAADRSVAERIEMIDGVATQVIELTAANGDVDTLTGIEVVHFAELRSNVATAQNPLLALAEAIGETCAGQPIGRGWAGVSGFELGLAAGGSVADANGAAMGSWTFSGGTFRAFGPDGAQLAVASVSFGVVDGKTTLMVAISDTPGAAVTPFAQLHALLAPLHDALQAYVADNGHSGATLDQLWIGGHSLAGTVLQTWTGETNGFPNTIPVTFGAPGAPEAMVEGPVIAVTTASDVAPIVDAIARYNEAHGTTADMIPGLPPAMFAALAPYMQALAGTGTLGNWAYNVRVSGPEGVHGDPVAAHSIDAYLAAMRTLTEFAPDHPMFGNQGYFEWGEDGAVNFMFGADGAEVLSGYPFDLLDTLYDHPWWLRAATEIWGRDGADTLVGGDCNDVLFGGLGNDVMTGGPTVPGVANEDTFMFDGLSRDTVTDFEWNDDLIDLRPALQALGLGEDAFDSGRLTLGETAEGAVLIYMGAGEAPRTIGVFNRLTLEELREATYLGTHITKPPLLAAPDGSSVTFTEDAPAVRLMEGATLGDPVITRYQDARITLTVSDSAAQIGLHAGLDNGFTLDRQADGTMYLMNGKTIVGRVDGLGTSTITVSFSAAATPAMVEQALSAFDAQVPGDDPAAGSFDVALTLTVYGRAYSVGQQLTVVPVYDLARSDTAALGEDQVATGSLTANDLPVDGGAPRVAAINGDPAAVGKTITLASGAKLTVQADGSYLYDPDHAFDRLLEGQSATEHFTYTLADGGGTATVTLTIQGRGLPIVQGTARADTLVGTHVNDLFDLSQGGNDKVDGNGGIDTFYFGGAFTARDTVTGSSLWGDSLVLQGNYDVKLSDTTISGIDRLVLMSGADDSWGDHADRRYDYRIRLAVGSVAEGNILLVDGAALDAAETLDFAAAPETIGHLFVTGGAANDTIATGAGNDLLDGGAGADVLRGGLGDDIYVVDHAGDIVVERADEGTDTVHTTLAFYRLDRPIENLVYTGAAAFEGTGNDRANVITGGARADTLFGLAGDDVLSGGGGDDVLRGGRGADIMVGGAGSDEFRVFREDSLGADYDTILDFDFAEDTLRVAGRGYHRSADVSPATLDGGTLENDLTGALSGVLGAGGVSIVTAAGGELKGHVFLVIDQDGAAGYGRGSDLVIDITGATNMPAGGVDFLL